MSYLICDLLVAAIIVLFVWRGSKKGFVLSLCGLLAIIVAFVGASFAARLLSPVVSDFLQPRLAVVIEKHLDEHLEQAGHGLAQDGENTSLPVQQVLDTLRSMGVYEDMVDAVDEAIGRGLTHAAADTIAQVAAAISSYVAFRLIFLVAFLLILAAWGIFSRTVNLVTYLPGIHFLNKAGGAVIGFLKAVLILFLAVWLMQLLGTVIPEETVRQTWLLQFFFTHSPLELLGM